MMNPRTDPRLEVLDLAKSYITDGGPVPVLTGVTFSLAAGDSVAVVGPSGCGKSTLLQVIGTLDEPTRGKVRIEGQDPFELGEADLARFRNEKIGFVFQDHHLLPQYTLLENVLLPTLAFPGGPSAEGRARELLRRVGLSHRLDHRPAQLSGGERQRTAIARALIHRPAILLCDEPTGNLDEASAASVADLLFELHDPGESLLVVVTHSMELAGRFDRRLQMRGGTCIEL